MDKCKKITFETLSLAKARAKEINLENSKKKKRKKQRRIELRAYKCKDCGKFHLSSMPKHRYMWNNDANYRSDVREKVFIKKESEYWEEKFNNKDRK
jgi:hypothetical protein